PRESPRSVRYQWPRRSPSITAPRNAAPATSWRNPTTGEPSAVPAIAPSMTTDSGVEATPSHRATTSRRANKSRTHTRVRPASAAASPTDHEPAELPEIRPTAAERHAASASTSTTKPVSLKNPRLSSRQSGVRNTTPSPPAASSPSTIAVTPAGPFTHRPPCREQPTEAAKARRAGPTDVLVDGRSRPRSVGCGSVDDWRSDDAVAEIYERVHAHRMVEPARDLLAMSEPPSGGKVLDVGCGTGAAVALAHEMLGPSGLAVGVDVSLGMLRVGAGARPGVRLAA